MNESVKKMPIDLDSVRSAIQACISLIDSRIIHNEEMVYTIETLDRTTLLDFYFQHLFGSKELFLLLKKNPIILLDKSEKFNREIREEIGLYNIHKARLENLKAKIDEGYDAKALTEFIDQIRFFIWFLFEKKYAIHEHAWGILEEETATVLAGTKDRKLSKKLYMALEKLKKLVPEFDETTYYRALLNLFPYKSLFLCQVETFIKFQGRIEDVGIDLLVKEIDNWCAECKKRLEQMNSDGMVFNIEPIALLLQEHQKQLSRLKISGVTPPPETDEVSITSILAPEIIRLFNAQMEIEQQLEELALKKIRAKEQIVFMKAEILQREQIAAEIIRSRKKLDAKLAQLQVQERIAILEGEQREAIKEVEAVEVHVRRETESHYDVSLQNLKLAYHAELSKVMQAFNRTFPRALNLSSVDDERLQRAACMEHRRLLSARARYTLESIYRFGMKQTSGVIPDLSFEEIVALIVALGGRKQTGRTTGSHHKFQMQRMELHILDHEHVDTSEHSLTIVSPHKDSNRQHIQPLTLKICFRVFNEMGIFKILEQPLTAEPAAAASL